MSETIFLAVYRWFTQMRMETQHVLLLLLNFTAWAAWYPAVQLVRKIRHNDLVHVQAALDRIEGGLGRANERIDRLYDVIIHQ